MAINCDIPSYVDQATLSVALCTTQWVPSMIKTIERQMGKINYSIKNSGSVANNK